MFGLNALNFIDYFEYCRSKNLSSANHPYSASDRLRKKMPNFAGFSEILGKIDQFGGNFAEIFGATFFFLGKFR